MTPRVKWILLGSALVGLGFAGSSTWVHYKLITDLTYVSPCDVNTTFNCTQAYMSRFGSVGGVPVALLGLAWFALVALITAFARPVRAGAPPLAAAYVFALSLLAMPAILYLAWASFFVLKTWCLLCLGTYASVFVIFITSGLAASKHMMVVPQRLFGDLKHVTANPMLFLVAVLFVTATASAVAFFPREGQQSASSSASAGEREEFEKAFADAWAQQPRVDLGVAAEGAKVVIVKFNDYLCPACKQSGMAYEPILAKYRASHPGAVKLVSKDWPWNTECNFRTQSTFAGHESACVAAAAVRMARDRGKGDELDKWLFANQEKLIELGMRDRKAEAIDLIKKQLTDMAGVTDFDKQYPARLEEIRRDVANGNVLGVQSTPTYYVNGVLTTRRESGNLPPDALDLAIRLELAKAGGQ